MGICFVGPRFHTKKRLILRDLQVRLLRVPFRVRDQNIRNLPKAQDLWVHSVLFRDFGTIAR